MIELLKFFARVLQKRNIEINKLAFDLAERQTNRDVCTTLDTAAALPPSTTTNSTPTATPTSYTLDIAAKRRKQTASGPR
jgi:acetyl-CoA acetyltransferase